MSAIHPEIPTVSMSDPAYSTAMIAGDPLSDRIIENDAFLYRTVSKIPFNQ